MIAAQSFFKGHHMVVSFFSAHLTHHLWGRSVFACWIWKEPTIVICRQIWCQKFICHEEKLFWSSHQYCVCADIVRSEDLNLFIEPNLGFCLVM